MSVEIDHLVVRAPSLEVGVEAVERRTGVRAAAGGAHPGMGTHNALISLGPTAYLEIIAPDPAQPLPPGGRPFGVSDTGGVELVNFAVHPTGGADIDSVVEAARAIGHDLGPIAAMSRRRPDGRELEWRLTFPPGSGADLATPFVIDWGATPIPARSSPSGCSLVELSVRHPAPESLVELFAAIGLDIDVAPAPDASLGIRLTTPQGTATLDGLG